jgi:hypothetical protein
MFTGGLLAIDFMAGMRENRGLRIDLGDRIVD